MNDTAKAVEILNRKISARADDAASRYRLAVVLLDEHARTGDPALLSFAREHLARAIELRPTHAPSRAALGYAYDLAEDGANQALACFREARRLDPQNRQYDVYVLTSAPASTTWRRRSSTCSRSRSWLAWRRRSGT